jgi:tetratricopeptide (TPR) repeat protein
MAMGMGVRGWLKGAGVAAAVLCGSPAAWAGPEDCAQALDDWRSIKACTAIIEAEPGAAWAYVRRGFSRLRAGQKWDAVADLDEAGRLEHRNARAYLGRGIYFAGASKERAREELREARRLDPSLEIEESADLADVARSVWERAPGEVEEGDVNGLLKRARARELFGQGQKAAADYSEVIRLEPGNAQAWHGRANARHWMRDFEGAIRDYTEALQLKPDRAASYAGRARAYREQGDQDRVIADLGEAIRLDPADATLRMDRAIAYHAKGLFDQAIMDDTEAIRLRPEVAELYVQRGLAYLSKQEHRRATADFSEAIRIDPRWKRAHAVRGKAYLDRGDTDAALEDFEAALRLDPRDIHALTSRGLVFEAWEDTVRAMADFDAAAMLGGHVDAYLGRARIYSRRPDREKALADLAEALKREPDNGVALRMRAELHEFEGERERAIAAWSEMIRLRPKEAAGYEGRARLHMLDNHFAGAIADLSALIGLEGGTVGLFERRAAAHHAAGDFDAAIADWSEAIRLMRRMDPVYDVAESVRVQATNRINAGETGYRHYERGRCYEAKGDKAAAIADYREVIRLLGRHAGAGEGLVRLAPDSAEGYLAVASARRGDDEAMAAFHRAIELDPSNAQAHAGRAEAYERKGDVERAIADLNEAIRLAPEMAHVYATRGVLYDDDKKDAPRAIEDFMAAARIDPNYYAHLGHVQLKEKAYDAAIASFTKALAARPEKEPGTCFGYPMPYLPQCVGGLYLGRMKAYAARGDHNAVIADADRVLNSQMSENWAYRLRGEAWLAKGEKERAFADLFEGARRGWDEKDFDRVLKLAPDNAAVHLEQGRAILRAVYRNEKDKQENRERAIAAFTQALRLDGGRVEAYRERGKLYFEMRAYGRAIADLTEVIARGPVRAEDYGLRGRALFYRRKESWAIGDLTAAIRLAPEIGIHYHYRGLARLAVKDYERAMADLLQVARKEIRSGESGRLELNKGRVEAARGNAPLALEYYGRQMRQTPGDPEVYRQRGLLLQDKGDVDGAIRDYTKAIELDPDNVELYWARASAHWAMRRDGKALQDAGTYWAKRLWDLRKE